MKAKPWSWISLSWPASSVASVGVDPALMGIAPVYATRRCLDRAGWQLSDVDLIEVNEAFAAQAISVGKMLEWDRCGST